MGGLLGSSILLLSLILLGAFPGLSAVVIGLRKHNGANAQRRPGFAGDEPVCDIFSGRWIQDDTYPLYQYLSCPIIDPEFNCQLYGRPDSEYLRYKWKPADCELPRFVFFEFCCQTLTLTAGWQQQWLQVQCSRLPNETERQDGYVCGRLPRPKPVGVADLHGSFRSAPLTDAVHQRGSSVHLQVLGIICFILLFHFIFLNFHH